ncbi:hypothetical protein [Glycomyces algeriensis]|uniref:Uncharacterized protein n=1 Tax=Glycomyces algeriensis TaxID=256037 RepID=A0A9W6GD81_9ACTN|nr:hypothetical protein [Glycomyces algeriensis]MDA1368243.1 hypothetical protein [Glycomyces algeriensis]MDR7351883.1 hypothetical protein [Glycomyces algeriensis]GLI44613.1 hypothetical protein GALLR39Z86_44630 [Glycomyces algeriensis]
MTALTLTAATAPAATGPAKYLRLVRASAIYDLIVTAAFATPWTFMLLHNALDALSGALGLRGFPELDLMQVFYANLMGSVVVVWSLLRVVRPQVLHGLFDGIARVLFSSAMVYALANGGPQLLWGFLVLEAAWGVAQLGLWNRARRA